MVLGIPQYLPDNNGIMVTVPNPHHLRLGEVDLVIMVEVVNDGLLDLTIYQGDPGVTLNPLLPGGVSLENLHHVNKGFKWYNPCENFFNFAEGGNNNTEVQRKVTRFKHNCNNKNCHFYAIKKIIERLANHKYMSS